ncbi:MAG: TRAP transporter small permease [Eubacteriales bacterium]|nr:TRAP transporter small permease [Eubacteriales bacterium]
MRKLDDVISKIEEYLLSMSILIMAAVLIAGVIARTIFNSSLSWTEEVGQALNIAITFLGIGYCAKMARHISMSVVYDLVPKKIKKIMTYIISLLTAVIMAYLVVLATKYVIFVHSFGRTSSALGYPMWIVYLVVPIGFAFGAIEYFKTFIMNVKHRDEIYISSKFKLGENQEDYDIQQAEIAESEAVLPDDEREKS